MEPGSAPAMEEGVKQMFSRSISDKAVLPRVLW